ncbi:hypothetical protein [Prauserella cavernicola]|uniref:DUF5666 domain-containing protein n=1 Tax=Prauserella cavernicola TaxID=2800127 RepID=A0A934V6N6_9PSEU|nr:hypothetical protein [Prauserella cavernicola]MBK1786400.1 hypothetical protein [Prauserella cavernicola]
MTDEQRQQGWGDAHPGENERTATTERRRGGRAGRTVAAVAIAAGLAAAGGVAVHAASADTSGASAQAPPGGMVGSALHGEYVVSDGDGGYRTELTQTGTVTALSGTELTAESEDGYTRTYTVDAATALDGIADGDTVTIAATAPAEAGGDAVLDSVTEGGRQATPGQGTAGPDGAPPRRDDDESAPIEG